MAIRRRLKTYSFNYGSRADPTDVYQWSTHSGATYHLSSTYYANGSVKTLSSNGLNLTLTYDVNSEGQTYAVSATAGQNPLTSVTYNNSSQAAAVHYGSGDSDSFSFDPNMGLPTSYSINIGAGNQTATMTNNPNGSLKTLAVSDTFYANEDETCQYLYDSDFRLFNTNCGASGWQGNYSYDQYGNIDKSGSTAFQPTYNTATNRYSSNWLNGSTYDQNGNVTTLNNATLSYDVENRLSEYTTGSFVENYAYDEANRRVDRWSGTTYDNVYFYGPNGKLLTVVQVNFNPTAPYVTASTLSNRIYFGKMLLGTTNGQVNTDSSLIKDRLGSVQPSYAYGTATGSGEQTSPGDDFATYWKDSSTGFQYAMNRYYSTGYGRFLTVDIKPASARITDPGTWNRYQYAGGDPINA